MDNAVLTPVVEELERTLTGATIGDVVQIDSRRFALRFSVPPFPRLCVTLHPDLSALHLTQRAPTPKEPTELSEALSERLGGLRLAGVRKEPTERVVEMEFTDGGDRGGVLVLELLGKSSNLLLLDQNRRILRFVRSHQGAFRHPREGDIYVPPPARSGAGAALFLGSRILDREVAARAARGDPPDRVRAEIEARIARRAWDPCLYTPRPLDAVEEGDPLGADVCFVAPFPLAAGAGLSSTRFGSMNEAAATHAELLLRHLLFRDMKASLAALVRGEGQRTAGLVTTLERELAESRRADDVRRQAELLLASVGTARKEGAEVEVVDYFSPALPRIRLAVDPRLDLLGNAEALFRRARKLGRAAAIIAERLDLTRERLAGLEGIGSRIADAATTENLHALEEEMNRSGLVKVLRRSERPEVGRRPSYVRVREYRTSDGYTVLVGKTAAENDLLTFKIAAPHDFWLHAAGRAGAHVVVRNPRRARDLPSTTLMEAAGIASWFSKGQREEEIEVHYAQRKDVRKGRGMSPGMVMLKRYRTVRARPALPGGAAGEGSR